MPLTAISHFTYLILLSIPLLTLLPSSTNGSLNPPPPPANIKCHFCLALNGEKEEPKKECFPNNNFKELGENVRNRTKIDISDLGGSGQPNTCLTMYTKINLKDEHTQHLMKLTIGIQREVSQNIFPKGILNETLIRAQLSQNGHKNDFDFRVTECKTDFCNGQGNLLPKIMPVLALGLCIKYYMSVLI